ncbi:hypothetical protein [Sulfurimonas sp.]|uniref:hypothetical protein n=1 Tax=Sulfurimonas sp. TaxID=2022749 RepID=UPI003D1005B5
MAEGEDLPLADFNIRDDYQGDWEDTEFIDNIQNKNDDSFTIQQTRPHSPSLLKKELKIQEKKAREQKRIRTNIIELNKLLNNSIRNSDWKFTQTGIKKLAEYYEDFYEDVIEENENLYWGKKNKKDYTITTDHGDKGWRLKAYSTVQADIGKEMAKKLKTLLETPDPVQTAVQVKQRYKPMDNVQQAQTQTEKIVNEMLNQKRQIKTILDATPDELESTGLFSPQAIREIKAAQSAVDELAKEKDNRFQKIEYLEKELEEAKKRGDETERKRLEESEKFQREELNIITQEHKNQIERIKKIWRKAITQPDSKIPLKEGIQLLFKLEGITIISIMTAIGMIFTSLGLGIANAIKPTTTPTPTPPTPNTPKSIPDKVKDGLKQLAKYLLELAKKSAAALPGIIGSIVSFLLKSMGNAALFLAEHVLIFLFAAVSFIIYGLIDLAKNLFS